MNPPLAGGWNPLAGVPLLCRADMVAALRRLLAPLAPYRSPGRARVVLSVAGAAFDQAAAALEGFARPLWGGVPAALGGDDVIDWADVRVGLTHGSDPAHPEFWGWPGDEDQRLVELAAIGFALMAAPERVWTPLPSTAQANLAAYLRQAASRRFSPNNWMCFRLLVEAGLRRVGETVPEGAGAAERAAIDALYLGEGWYRDGPGRRVDHYTGFAFHTYGLLLHHFASQTDAPEHLPRARAFAPQFAAWFDPVGRCLPFGRSMTYRFAMASFFGAYALADTDPILPWGVLKGIILRHLRWWATQPIADRDGVLSVGFAYPNPAMAENYNSACSPYWALKAFLPLALPEGHPFWEAAELPLPMPPQQVLRQSGPGFLMQPFADQTVALSAGQEARSFRHGDEKYAKFAYSTRFPFCVETRDATLHTAALDGMLGVQSAGRPWMRRHGCATASLSEEIIHAVWHPYPDVRVETWLMPWEHGHLRLHRITSAVPLETVEGGFAVERREGAVDRCEVSERAALVCSGAASLVRDLSGGVRRPRVHSPEANTSLAFPRCWVPQLLATIDPGVTVLASYCAAGDGISQADGPDLPPGFDPLDLLPPVRHRQPIGAMTGTAAV